MPQDVDKMSSSLQKSASKKAPYVRKNMCRLNKLLSSAD